jgi:hypothetical protein
VSKEKRPTQRAQRELRLFSSMAGRSTLTEGKCAAAEPSDKEHELTYGRRSLEASESDLSVYKAISDRYFRKT